MIIDLNEDTITQVQNPDLASYATIYLRINQSFIDQVKATGIEFDDQDYSQERREKVECLLQKGAVVANNGHSIYINEISPSCVACRRGIATITEFISLKCHRDCYYCFNPNQQDYDRYQKQTRDLITDLDRMHAEGREVKHIALTGGEPLLHKAETIAFFSHAHELYPDAYTRLYTCGDHIDKDVLAQLRECSLDEIRISIRMHDLESGHGFVFDHIALAKEYVPYIMVEMPVLPGTFEQMKEVLLELERLKIFSINLLEFCYPLFNAQEYVQRDFKVKKRPYLIPYNYWYAGGVPISGSEILCLDLVEYALDQNLSIGVHYCSLENKFTGQVYQQNAGQEAPGNAYLSARDFFLKSGKVFGKDIPKAKRTLRKNGGHPFDINTEHNYLEFHLDQVDLLAGVISEVGVSYNVLESRPEGQVMRELKIDLTRPEEFDFDRDV